MKPGTSLLMILTVFAGLYQTTAQVAFAPAANYAVGKNPYSVAAADVNGDGKVDLICANRGANNLMVFTNNGSGVFGSNATYAVFSYPESVVAADVNGDGKVDLVCYCSSGSLKVLTNNGSGSFVNAGNYAVGGNNLYGEVIAADVNGDGRVDLICPGVGNPLMLLTNAGNGVFAAAAPLPSSPGTSWFCAATDVNGDGKTDLIDVDGTTGSFSYMRVLTNDGSGTFTLCSSNTLTTRWPGIGTTVDINGDGKAALVVPDYDSGSGNTLTVLTNNGDGVFGSNATYVVAIGLLCVIAADVQGDGKADLICGKFTGNTLSVLTNNGSGRFGSNSTYTVGSNPMSIAAADVTGSGKMDLISANATFPGTVTVLINTSIFPPPTSTPALTINPSGNSLLVSWPSASAGWSLQQNPDLTTMNWSPSGYSGYGISDDGTNKSLIITPPTGNLFFRLLHP
jgi:hypothetical protein